MDDIFFAAEIDSHIARIDLHTEDNILSALEQLEQKLFLLFNKEERYVRIIYGIGSGRLRISVHEALSKNPLVKSWKESEGGGSCIILF